MAEIEPAVASTLLVRDLFLFLCAVLVGTTAGIGSQQALLHLTSPQAAASLSLALATTCTGAAHTRLVAVTGIDGSGKMRDPRPRRREVPGSACAPQADPAAIDGQEASSPW